MTVLPKVLAWSAMILGAFLLYTFLAPSSSSCQYNIGCYLAPHSLNHTAQLQARIASAKTQRDPIAYQYHSVIGDKEAFQKKVMTVAHSFQKYVQQIAKQQQLRHQDRQVVTAIKDAEKAYLQCKGEIDATMNKTSCHHNWREYQHCFQRIKTTQAQLDQLFQFQAQIQELITAEIERPQTDPEDSPEVAAERIYNESMKINDINLEDYRRRLAQNQARLDQIKLLNDKAEDRLETKEHTHKECSQNRKFYRQCEEISEQVKNLNMGTLKQLEQQLEAKKRLMDEMREMIVRMGKGENRKLPDHWNEMYQAHVAEYKQMHKDFIHYNKQMERKACGCSEEEEKYFLAEVENEKKIIHEYQVELADIGKIVSKLKKAIQEKEQERDKIISDYQKALKEYETTAPQLRESQLIKLKNRLENNRKKILDSENTFNEIDQSCKVIKKRLAASVKDIDRVEECLTKKEYLKKLKVATKKYLEPARSLAKLLETKRMLVDSLTALQL